MNLIKCPNLFFTILLISLPLLLEELSIISDANSKAVSALVIIFMVAYKVAQVLHELPKSNNEKILKNVLFK